MRGRQLGEGLQSGFTGGPGQGPLQVLVDRVGENASTSGVDTPHTAHVSEEMSVSDELTQNRLIREGPMLSGDAEQRGYWVDQR